MKAYEVRMLPVLSARAHYVVPLFQRRYSWQTKHWAALWSDILVTYTRNPPGCAMDRPHFLGALVAKVIEADFGGIGSFLLVNGQQRLTTLLILLAALRDVVRSGNPLLAQKLNDVYLTNSFTSPPRDQKLLPSQLDQADYAAIIRGNPPVDNSSHVVDAYRYFSNEIRKAADYSSLDAEHLERVLTSGLEVVSITLDGPENEYRIFESLNARGATLTQADLLRNYFFMHITADRQEQIYQDLWRPMQEMLGEGGLADFIRDLLIAEGTFIRVEDVYQEWKTRLEPLSASLLVEKLTLISRVAGLYKRLVAPEAEPDPEVSAGVRRLNRWGASTIYPFLLNVYRSREQGDLDDGQVAQVLGILESYLVRRLLGGVSTNALNRIFVRLWYQLPAGTNVVDGTRAALSEPGVRWPRDRDLQDAVTRVPFYLNGRSDQRKFVLEQLERQLNANEPVDPATLTIEHVMPQTLTPAWQSMLGRDAYDTHQTLLHTLGNITLTGYNTPLSNKPFGEKRRMFAASNVALNREIAHERSWTAREILARAARLAAKSIEHWPGPIASVAPQTLDLTDEGDLLQNVLTRIPIPAGQIDLFRVLYDAGDGGATAIHICERIGCTPAQLGGILGALGRRVNGSLEDQTEEKPGISLLLGWERMDGQWRYWLRPEFRAALETNGCL